MVLRFLEDELRNLSVQIGAEWQELATRLGFTSAKIHHFRINHIGDVANAIFEMLVKWQEQLENSCNDSMSTLGVALKKIGRADLAHDIASRNGFRGTRDPISYSVGRRFTSGQTYSAKTDEPDNQNTDQSVPPHSSNRWGHQPHSTFHNPHQPSAQGGSLIQTQGSNNTTFVVNFGAQGFGLAGAGPQNYGVQSGDAPESSRTPLINTRGDNNSSMYIGSHTTANIGRPEYSNSTASSAQTSERNQRRPFTEESSSNVGMGPQRDVQDVQSGDAPESSRTPLINTRGDNNSSMYIGSHTTANIGRPEYSNSTASSAQTSERNQRRPFTEESSSNVGMGPQRDVQDADATTSGVDVIGSLRSNITLGGDHQIPTDDPSDGEDFIDLAQLKAADMIFGDIIGSGAFGDVYYAKFKNRSFRGHREAAVKTLNKLQPKEVEILQRVNHPNVVKLLAYVEERPTHLIVMELADQSLRQYLDSHECNFPQNLCEKWVWDVCKAIHYLHGGIVGSDGNNRAVVHRDIKASNCLIFRSGAASCLKVADFSISREANSTIETKTGRGSLQWTSPEVLYEHCFSKASDIYSLGVLFWEMYTQNIPKVQAREILGQPIEGEFRRFFPDYMLQLLPRCWKKIRGERPTIKQVMDVIPHDSAGVGYQSSGRSSARMDTT